MQANAAWHVSSTAVPTANAPDSVLSSTVVPTASASDDFQHDVATSSMIGPNAKSSLESQRQINAMQSPMEQYLRERGDYERLYREERARMEAQMQKTMPSVDERLHPGRKLAPMPKLMITAREK